MDESPSGGTRGKTGDATLVALAAAARAWRDPDHPPRREAAGRTLSLENRFTEPALAYAVNRQMSVVTVAALEAWRGDRRATTPRPVGVLGAGNVPLASFQDYLAVLVTGHRFLGCESSRSPFLLPAFARDVEVRGGPPARFPARDALFDRAEAVIASGTTDTMEAVARRCPQRIPPERRLLRGTRFAVAIVDGRETTDQRIRWAEDVLLHEGLGCRNVAITFAAAGTPVDPYLKALAVFRSTFPAHPRTAGTLRMQQAFLKAVGAPHAWSDDLQFLVSRGRPEVQPPGHLRWVEVERPAEAHAWIATHADSIQVVACRPALARFVPEGVERCAPGDTQRPPLDWRPDGIDTIEFLAGL